jgi:regulator of protease activity HflC (stomatin/prohibitin superfamily)
MTYEDCIEMYGTSNDDYCTQYPPAESAPLDSFSSFIGDIFGNLWTWVLIVIVLILVVISIKIVRHMEVGLVERLGRYNRPLNPGFHMIIPIFERVVERVDLRQYQLDVKTSVKTSDEQMVKLPVAVILKVTDPEASFYQVEDPEAAIQAIISNEVKAKSAGMTLQQIFDDRESIKQTVDQNLNQKIAGWGFEVTEVVIDNPELTEEMQAAYNSVAAAERSKQAATAEGDAYKIRRDRIADGNADAVKKMMGTTGLTAAEAAQFLISVDSNDAIRDAAKSGATVVVGTASSDQATLGLVATQQ